MGEEESNGKCNANEHKISNEGGKGEGHNSLWSLIAHLHHHHHHINIENRQSIMAIGLVHPPSLPHSLTLFIWHIQITITNQSGIIKMDSPNFMTPHQKEIQNGC